jgi:ATP-dependent RNA helicase DDX23/PRP28
MSDRREEGRRNRSRSPKYKRYEEKPYSKSRNYSPDRRRNNSPDEHRNRRYDSPDRHRRREYSPKRNRRDYSPERPRYREENRHQSSNYERRNEDYKKRENSPKQPSRNYEEKRRNSPDSNFLEKPEPPKKIFRPSYELDDREHFDEDISRDGGRNYEENRESFGNYEKSKKKQSNVREKFEFKPDFVSINKPQNEKVLQTSIEPSPNAKEIIPISLEDLKKESEANSNSKPIFMSKKERKKQDSNDEKSERAKKIEEMRLQRENMLKQRNEPESHVDKQELEDIRKDYYGENKQTKRVYKASERTKFVFDWDASEDTSHDINNLYDQKHEAILLFGKGKRAGMDEREHEKNSKFYSDFLQDKAKNENIILAPKKKSRFELESEVQHWTQKTRKEMTERDWRIFCEDNDIATKGGKVPHPIRNWEEGNFPKHLMDAIKKAKYEMPTPIQMQCIPIGLENRDIIGISETGSGKTAAFLLPLLVYVSNLPKMTKYNCFEGPYALILAPTRELANQIEAEAIKLAKDMDIRIVSLIGGVSKETQSFALKQGAEIIIATPGRLIDTLDSRIIVLNQCNYIVLDEFDKMISMNFIDQVNSILDSMPSSNLRPENEEEMEDCKKIYRQTILFSATMSNEVEKLASKYMRNKIVVIIGEIGRAAKKIEQRIQFIKQEEKKKKLTEALEETDTPIIVFVNLKKTADEINKQIEQLGFRSTVLHGQKSQDQRNFALDGFKKGKYEVLVATNVVSRGIDIVGVKCVINYDMPYLIDDYQHRIGRTARAGKTGIAISFLTEADTPIMFDLRQFLIHSNSTIPNELQHNEAALIKPGTIQTKNILK